MTETTENIKARDAIKKHYWKYTKQDSSDSLLSDSDSSDKSDYKSKKCNKKKSYPKREPIKLCTTKGKFYDDSV